MNNELSADSHTFHFSNNVKVIDHKLSSSMSFALRRSASSIEGFVRGRAAHALAAILDGKHFISTFLGNQRTFLNRLFSLFVVSIQAKVLSLKTRDGRIPRQVV